MTEEERKAAEAAKREAEEAGITGTLQAVNDSLERVQGSIDDAANKAQSQSERLDALEKATRKTEGIGLTDEETSNFSISRAALAIEKGNWRGAEFEREAMDAAANKRAQSTLTNGAGGFLLPTEVSNRIIEPLMRESILGAAGAEFMEGMRGTFNMPKATEGEMQDRNDAAAVSDQSANWAYTQVQLSANYSGQLVEISRSLLQQDVPAADAYVERRLMKTIQRKVDAVGLAKIQALTSTTDLIAKAAAAGDKLTPNMLHRAVTLLQNSEALGSNSHMALVSNPLVKWHVINGASYTSATPWMPYANDKALGDALGATVHSTTFFNDDSGINGEACLGVYENLIVALFGEGIEIASSEHSKFEENLVVFRALLAADAAIIQDSAFVHWDNLGDA